jgi:hypothetical protein
LLLPFRNVRQHRQRLTPFFDSLCRCSHSSLSSRASNFLTFVFRCVSESEKDPSRPRIFSYRTSYRTPTATLPGRVPVAPPP